MIFKLYNQVCRRRNRYPTLYFSRFCMQIEVHGVSCVCLQTKSPLLSVGEECIALCYTVMLLWRCKKMFFYVGQFLFAGSWAQDGWGLLWVYFAATEWNQNFKFAGWRLGHNYAYGRFYKGFQSLRQHSNSLESHSQWTISVKMEEICRKYIFAIQIAGRRRKYHLQSSVWIFATFSIDKDSWVWS